MEFKTLKNIETSFTLWPNPTLLQNVNGRRYMFWIRANRSLSLCLRMQR